MRNVKENNSKNENETEVNLNPPTKTEIKLALTQLKNGKAIGLDNINLEVLKADPEITVEMLYPLVEKIWKEEKIPEEWDEGLIIKIPKKGDQANCNNWRGVTLLSTPSKIPTRIILNRIQDTVEHHLGKEQSGFCKHQSCVDLINILRIILEQRVEWQAILYVTFIDFDKAFDFVKREVMWLTLKEYSIPRKITQIIKMLYDKFRCKISHEGKLSEFIEFRNGVRQGYILSPTLFLLILDRVMKTVKGFRKRGIQCKMKERLKDLDYTDICRLVQRFCDMEEKLKRLKEEAESAGLYININKTEGMRVNTSNTQKFRIENTEIEVVGLFVYLESVVSENGGTEEDVASRIKKAYGNLFNCILCGETTTHQKELK